MPLKFELPQLPYSYDALEPVISKKIMELHYDKHHRAYVTNLNKALEQLEVAEKNNNLAEIIALQKAIKFNGGGDVNHSIFWTNLAPKKDGGGQAPTSPLADEINKTFGSLQNLIDQMSAKGAALQGSGWVWLGYNKSNKRLEIETCDNQDPLSTKGLIPLLGIDVWEHAYYLQYLNVRPDYIKSIWEVINWKNVAERFEAAKK